MTATLQNTAQLANDPLFQGRVQAAMMTAAVSVASEAIGTMNLNVYQLRHALAIAILQGSRLPGGNIPVNGWLQQFAWAVASNPTISGDLGSPVSIAASTAVNPSVISCGTVHGMTSGQWAEISGHLVNTAINGVWEVTVIDVTHFSVPVLGNGAGGATGVVQLQPPDADIQFTVNSLFGDIAGVGTVS